MFSMMTFKIPLIAISSSKPVTERARRQRKLSSFFLINSIIQLASDDD